MAKCERETLLLAQLQKDRNKDAVAVEDSAARAQLDREQVPCLWILLSVAIPGWLPTISSLVMKAS